MNVCSYYSLTFFLSCGDWTQGFPHARQTCHCWATSPVPNYAQTCFFLLLFLHSTQPLILSTKYPVLYSLLSDPNNESGEKKVSLGNPQSGANFQRRKERVFHHGSGKDCFWWPLSHCAAILDFCFLAGLGLHERPEDGRLRVWQEDWDAPDNQALMTGRTPWTSARCGVLAGGVGSWLLFPCASSTPLDWIWDANSVFLSMSY